MSLLTDVERQIISATIELNDPTIFSNWFIRGKGSGTLLVPGDTREVWAGQYKTVHSHWERLFKPDYFGEVDGEWVALTPQTYRPMREALKNVYEFRSGGKFFTHHGYRYLKWQAQMYQAKQGTVICVGGMSSGKTTSAINTVLTYAATLPNFYAICPAPSYKQAKDIWRNKIQPHLKDTLFEKKFDVRYRSGDELGISLTTADGSESTILFMPLADKSKVKNIECDMFYVEQAEDFQDLVSGPDNIYTLIQTRLRGYIGNRERVAKSLWIANASHNMEIYALRDRAIDDPENYLSIQTSTYDNPHISQKHLNQMVSSVGENEEERAYYLFGDQPIGGGEHFPKSSIVKVFDSQLDELMKYKIRDDVPGWIHKTAKGGVGTYWWQRPYEPEGKYIVVADPGWGNPPMRSSASVIVLRVDGFPLRPASLYAFWWVYGNGSPEPWIATFINAVQEYHAIGSCGYDATSWQGQGYEKMEKLIYDVMPYRLILNVLTKSQNLNALKMLFSRAMIQLPNIEGLLSQLMNYVIPEPRELKQDLVMTLVVAAAMLAPLYNDHVWAIQKDSLQKQQSIERFERDWDSVPEDRYDRWS